ncbi:MAG: hypothetical protein JWM80_2124, partial [Cyanobacteria bacterium RYN_339]|nr:hypothetical protein [Cyanobacteria bacterium RYN_339]
MSPTRPFRLFTASIAACALAGCAPRATTAIPPAAVTGAAGGALSGLGGAVLLNGRMRGQVVAPDGSPAAGVQVQAHVLAVQGTGAAPARQVLQVGPAGTTDADGRFELATAEGDVAVIEAAQAGGLKAIRLNARAADGDLRLQLAPTGTITGRVQAPDQPGASDFTGVDVYIPGTSYIAKADNAGAYTISDVPVGDFVVLAARDGLGRGSVGVRVRARERAEAPAIALRAGVAVVASIAPPLAAPGQDLEIRGQGFGAATGAPIAVTLGGLAMGNVRRADDGTLYATVPPGAGSGDLVVTVGGVAGAPLPVGVVAKLVPLPGRDALLVGETVPLVAAGLDRQGRLLGDVAAAWRASGDALAVQDGRATAKDAGLATLTCGAGSLVAELTLPVRRTVGIATSLYEAQGGSPDVQALASIARSPRDGTLYLVERGREDAPAHIQAIDAQGVARAVPTAAGAPEPREVAVGPGGELYALGADGSIWQLAPGVPRRVLDPATLAGLLPAVPGSPGVPGPGPGAMPAGAPPTTVPKPHGLLADAAGRLVFQLVPGQAVRFKPGEPPKSIGFAMPTPPGQPAPAFRLATAGEALWAFLPRPNLAAALELVTEPPPGTLTDLTRDVGEVGGLA